MSVLNEKCQYCGKPAVWYYTPAGRRRSRRAYCDDCVPRGCSCQMSEKGTPRLDSEGRELPCCEYEDLREIRTVLHSEDHPENVGRKFTVAEMIDRGWDV